MSALGKLHSTVWAFVDSVRQDQPLLPKLCHLKLAVPVDSAAAYLRLLSPSLRHLKIAFLPSRDFALVGALTSLIASKLPRLQTLCVDGGLRAVPARYLTALSRLHRLQTLDLEDSGVSLPFSVLKAILQNTTLRALYALIMMGKLPVLFQSLPIDPDHWNVDSLKSIFATPSPEFEIKWVSASELDAQMEKIWGSVRSSVMSFMALLADGLYHRMDASERSKFISFWDSTRDVYARELNARYAYDVHLANTK